MNNRAQRRIQRRIERRTKDATPRPVITRLQQVLQLRRAVQLVWEAAPRWTVASVILMVFLSAIPVLILYATKLTIDEVTVMLTLPVEARDFNRIAPLIALMAGVALVKLVLNTANKLVNERQSRIVRDHVIDLIHQKSLEVDLEYYENSEYRDTLHRVQTDAPFRPPRIVTSLMSFTQNAFSLISLLVLLISFSPIIALVLFVSAIPGLFARVQYSRIMFSWLQRRAQTERVIIYYNYILTLVSYAKEIRLFDLGEMFARRHHDLREGMRKEEFVIQTRGALRDFVAQFTAMAAVYGSYAFIAFQTVAGAITLGSLVMYFQAFQRGQALLREMLGSVAELYEHGMFVSQFYEFLTLEGHVVAPPDALPIPKPMKIGIEFKNVSFSYPNSERSVLEGVSLTISPGEVIALVGENGAGKTTLIKLLCRLYDPTEGSITLDGIDLRRFDPVELRHHISAIFQDFSTYQATVWENIGYGDIQQIGDREKIIEAAKLSNAHPVIESLPDGYDSMLGSWFQRGEDLSIGQWQKIALARLFMRDAQLMILDEPTSALDVMSEYEVFERFRAVISGRSAILISHRLSTIKMAHKIYVLDDHKIAEVGSHDELMQQQGIYAKLFDTQSMYYR